MLLRKNSDRSHSLSTYWNWVQKMKKNRKEPTFTCQCPFILNKTKMQVNFSQHIQSKENRATKMQNLERNSIKTSHHEVSCNDLGIWQLYNWRGKRLNAVINNYQVVWKPKPNTLQSCAFNLPNQLVVYVGKEKINWPCLLQEG